MVGDVRYNERKMHGVIDCEMMKISTDFAQWDSGERWPTNTTADPALV